MVFCNLSYPVKKVTLIFLTGVLFYHSETLAAATQQPGGDTTLERLLNDAPENAGDTVTETKVEYMPPVPVVQRQVPDSVIQRLQRSKDFAYANDPEYWRWNRGEAQKSKPGPLSGLLRIVFYVMLTAAFIYALYLIIVSNKLHLFYSSSKVKKGDTGPGEEAEENIDQKISEAIAAGQYRVAIRYMYIKTLRLLDEKGWIKFSARHTNIDYVNALDKRPGGELFRFITKNYEYVWYGEFELKSRHFDYLHKKFEEFHKRLK